MSDLFIELQAITKRFPGVTANDHVDLTVRTGEIHAIVGENGAGKSTLMRVLYGLYQPDAGTIHVRGAPVQIDSPRRALQLGIGMVHQHFMLIPVFTVAENIILGSEPSGALGPQLDLKGSLRSSQSLDVGVRRDELDAAQPRRDHRIHRVAPGPADPNDFDPDRHDLVFLK